MNNLNQKITTKQFIISLIVLLIIILTSSALYYAKVANDLDLINNPNLNGLKVTTSIVKGDTAEIKYFATSTNSNIQARYPKGNSDAAVFLLNEIDIFKKDVGENDFNQERTTDFIATFATATSATTDSVTLKIYRNTGGAHGNQYYKVFNYDKNKSLITNDKLISNLSIDKIANYTESELKLKFYNMMESTSSVEDFYKSEENKSSLKWIQDGSAATSTNYSSIWLDGDNLVVYIGQYQAWAYAYGDAIVEIPVKLVLK